MEITRWNPFAELDGLLSRGGLASRLGMNEQMEWRPAADIVENEKEFVIRADLPQVSKDDIDISVANGVITLRGERRKSSESTGEKEHRVEKFYGSFTRSFAIPENVDAEKITASQANGVLTISLPKTESPEPSGRRIRIS